MFTLLHKGLFSCCEIAHFTVFVLHFLSFVLYVVWFLFRDNLPSVQILQFIFCHLMSCLAYLITLYPSTTVFDEDHTYNVLITLVKPTCLHITISKSCLCNRCRHMLFAIWYGHLVYHIFVNWEYEENTCTSLAHCANVLAQTYWYR